MMKKITTLAALSLSLVTGTIKDKVEDFKYSYRIVLNSNSTKDLMNGYTYKEYLIDNYNDIINYLSPELHTDAILNNIDKFAKEGSKAKYEDGIIVVYVGDAKGDYISGELKKDSCDTSNIRVKFFFSKYFFK